MDGFLPNERRGATEELYGLVVIGFPPGTGAARNGR